MYNVKTHKFHELHVCKGYTYENSIGPFNRFEKEQLQKLINIINKQNQLLEPIQEICHKYKIPIEDLPETLNKQFKKPSNITDKQINNLAYYCSMVYEMFLVVNWEYEKIGKGTTHHEVIRAGTEQLAKEYYFKGFKELLKEMGYDKNTGDEYKE